MLLNEVSVFSANSSPANGLRFFFHLNDQVIFRAHSPGSNVEGKGELDQLKFRLFHAHASFAHFIFPVVFATVSRVCVSLATQRTVGPVGG